MVRNSRNLMTPDDQKALSEIDALRKDWYERVFTAIEKLDVGLDGLASEARKIREEVKTYADSGDEKIEGRINQRLDDFLAKLNAIETAATDGVDKIREDIKDDKLSDKRGRRWIIGLALTTVLALTFATGGYFIAVEVVTERLSAVTKQQDINTAWHLEHHDKVENSFINSVRNKEEIERMENDHLIFEEEHEELEEQVNKLK